MQPTPPRSERLVQGLVEAGALNAAQVEWARQELARRLAAGNATTLQDVLLSEGLLAEDHLQEPQPDPDPKPQPNLEPKPRAEGDLPAPGESFGRFEILEVLGEGAMGRVYLALDPRLGRRVALKVIRSQAHLARFPHEARAMGRLSHPHVVTIYEFDQAEGWSYLAMEAIAGVDLTTYRRAAGAAPFLRVLEQVARAVAHAHSLGVVHRDLKPDNVLVDADGQARVTDFGVAQIVAPDLPSLTQTGLAIGTPLYMSPEQCAGDKERMGPPADVWALGVILYEGLCDRHPFDGATFLELVSEIASSQPPPPSSLCDQPRGAELDAICARALAKDPGQRYPDAGAFAADLARYLSAPPQRPSLGLRLGGVAALVALGVTLGFLLGGEAPPLPDSRPRAEKSPTATNIASDPALEQVWARSTNLLYNPGFELGRAGREGWEFEGAQGSRQAPYSEFSAVVVSPEGGELRQPIDLSERPWRRLRLSGMFRSQAAGRAELSVEWSGPSPGSARVSGALSPGLWSLVAGEVDLPAALTSAVFVARVAGARVDELSLEGLEDARLRDGARLPQEQPLAHAFRGLDGGESQLGAYAASRLHTEYSSDHAQRLRKAFPERPVLKQQAFGALTSRGVQAKVYPGHWLYARALRLRSALPARRRLQLELEVPGGVPAFRRAGKQSFPEAALVRAVGGELDLTRALHVRITGVRGRSVTCQALHHYPPGSPPLTFSAGEGVLLPHLPWRGSETWLLNLDPAGPLSPEGTQAADLYVADLAERAAGLSGVSLDLPYWQQDRLPGYPLDIDLDGVPDGGFREGLNVYALGQNLLLERLRETLGPRALIVVDGEPDKVRSWVHPDGVQLERFLFREGADDAARLSRFGFQFDHLRNVISRLSSPRRASYALCVVDSERFRQPEAGVGLEEVLPSADDPLVRIGLVSNALLDLPHAYVERDRTWKRPRRTLSDPFWPVPWGFYLHEGSPGWLGRPLEPLRAETAHLRAQVKIGAWQSELVRAQGYQATSPSAGGDPLRTHRVEVHKVPAGRPLLRGVELRSVLPVRLSRGEDYTLVFEARGQSRYRYAGRMFEGAPRAIRVVGLRAEAGNATEVLVDERWRMYSLPFRSDRNGPTEIRFGVSEQVGWTELRKVRLLRGAAARYSRRYSKGLVALNLTSEAWRLELPEGRWELALGPGELSTGELSTGKLSGGELRVPGREAVVLRLR